MEQRNTPNKTPTESPSPEDIRNTQLPSKVQELVTEYNNTIGIREEFVWKWMYNLLPEFTLNTVSPDNADNVREAKTILTMFVTIVDDIAESTNDYPTFLEAQKVPHPTAPPRFDGDNIDGDTLRVLNTVWDTLDNTLRHTPQYYKYHPHYRFDLNQTLNSIEYSQFITQHPQIANLNESWMYGPHNMVMYAYADIDLMHSPQIPDSDVRPLRKFLCDAQKMARIGNWVSTWEREIHDGDYGSGIVVKALEDNILTTEDLDELPAETIIERIETAELEEYFLDEWGRLYNQVDSQQYDTTEIDLVALRDAMGTILDYHLSSRGHK